MPLEQMPNTPYYTDRVNFYKSHTVTNPKDGLWKFAAEDLGMFKASKDFTPEESARNKDLQTKYLLLKNGAAVPITSVIPGVPDIKRDDVILRKVDPSTVPGLVRHSPGCSSYSLPGKVCSSCGGPLP